MDRRTLLALLLTAIVIVVTPMLFPSRRTTSVRGDSTRIAADTQRTNVAAPPARPVTPPPSRTDTVRRVSPATSTSTGFVAETTVVRTRKATIGIVSPGGVPGMYVLPEYRSLRPGTAQGAPVHLLEPGSRLFHLRLVQQGSRDTVSLDSIAFRAEQPTQSTNSIGVVLHSVSGNVPITLTYRLPLDSFVMHVEGSIAGPMAATTTLDVSLPRRIRSEEANVIDDTRHLSVAYKEGNADVASVGFRQLDTLSRIDTGSIRWISERNKYFVVAAIPQGRPFRSVVMRGGPHVGNEAVEVHANGSLPITDGRFSLNVYAGPQSWDHLRRAAPDLENVNPYGGWLHGLVQPFATIMMRLLLWMRHTLNVGYGWVLVIFGVLVRLLLWPLNQNAMRSSMKLQRIQPQLQELQKKYAKDPEKQRDAMMKLYQEHGMSPFTPILGCLPMLLPMPILFALYFVFSNTIELRGVSFLWLPDLSLRDPYFITPLFMGISMFLLSWIGMRGMPPNPQSKMMSYVMPVMFTVLFWNFASGLNLYYAVQNVAALPQQWLLARERTTQPPPQSKPPGKR